MAEKKTARQWNTTVQEKDDGNRNNTKKWTMPERFVTEESTCHCSAISMLRIGSFQSDVEDLDIVIRFVCFGMNFDLTDILNYLHSSDHSPKHGVLVVQPWL